MKSFRSGVIGLVSAISALAGCGTTSGALLGGVTGYALGGDTASTVGGAVAGGIIGNARGRR